MFKHILFQNYCLFLACVLWWFAVNSAHAIMLVDHANLMLHIFVYMFYNLGLVARIPVFGVSDKVRFKQACSATETS